MVDFFVIKVENIMELETLKLVATAG